MTDVTDPLALADTVLEHALSALRLLIEAAVREQKYSVLGQLGSIADSLTSLRRSVGGTESLEEGVVESRRDSDSRLAQELSPQTPPPLRVTGQTKTTVKAEKSYPRFERQDDRLVKIGWSKRDATEYEHKAPHAAIVAVKTALMAIKKKSFTMDELLPLRDGEGADVPSYQAYLVVAWLRQLKIVDRLGNNGYAVKKDRLTNGIVEREWKSLTTGQGKIPNVE